MMSEPLELKEQTPYAIDRLDTLKAAIMHSIQEMVIHRAKVEKYRKSDLPTARSAYETLEYFRKQLAEQLMESQLILLETEAYKLASMAGQLHQGVSGFNLMSTGYKPIYEVLNKFTSAFPTGQKTNAAVIGRLMNNIKLGYYPTDPDNISLILRGIRFPDGVTTNLFDPCCGCGKALRQLAQGNNCYAYGVELDESRAEEAQTRLHRVGFGSFFHSRISHEAFHLLFLNPPYLSVINESGGRSRHEKRFLIESLPPLMYGGLLIYVIPYYPMAGDEDIEMIMNELMLTVFDEGAPDDEDDMVTVRFSHDYIDRLYAQGCKDGGLFPFRINAWQEKIKDIFLFYVADASYSVFDVRYHFSGTNVKLDITLSPDCCTPDIFLNTFVNLILYCQREVERIEAVEADERNAVAYIGKEAA